MLMVIGFVFAGCRPAPPGGQQPPGQTVDVTAREWAFEPSPLVARAGTVTFRVKNDGGVEHTFTIERQPKAELAGITSGETKSLTVTLARGEYTVFCNLPGHREAGMVAPLTIE